MQHNKVAASKKPEGLERQVGLFGASLLGLGSILGTGVFVSLGLAVGVAGDGVIYALGLATLLAVCNALSSAQLAANHPVSGGTYAYGYRYLRPEFGFIAGLSFLLAKSASAAAAAIGLVSYLVVLSGWKEAPIGGIAAGICILMTGLVASGLRRANAVNTLLVAVTIGALVWLIGAVWWQKGLLGGVDWQGGGISILPSGFFEAAALLFVAFTGYGRIATLGGEVIAPRKTIPRAIIVTLWVAGALYLGVLLSGLAVLDSAGFVKEMQASAAPLQAIAGSLDMPSLRAFLSLAAITAMAGVLLNLVLGLSRVAYAMGQQGDGPAFLGRLRGQEPFYATLFVGGAIALIALLGGLFMVWSFSAFTVLIYYAITNLAALQLSAEERLYPRFISVLGLVGCLGLSIWITSSAIFYGVGALLLGLVIRHVFKR